MHVTPTLSPTPKGRYKSIAMGGASEARGAAGGAWASKLGYDGESSSIRNSPYLWNED